MFFFSGRGSQLQKSPTGMFHSLLCQLFSYDYTVRPTIVGAYTRKTALFGDLERTWQWARLELEEILKEAILTASQSRSFWIFVDALDKAGEKQARDIAAYFHRLNDLVNERNSSTKICISSRHYPVISNLAGANIIIDHRNERDIKRFMHDELSSQLGQFSFSPTDATWVHLIDTLARKAEGNFQWARMVINRPPTYQMDGESPRTILKLLHNLPNDLDDMYHHILLMSSMNATG